MVGGDGDGSLCDAERNDALDGSAGGATDFFRRHIRAFAKAGEEEVSGGGVEKEELFVGAVEFLAGEAAQEVPEQNRNMRLFFFMAKQDDGRYSLSKDVSVYESGVHSGGL